MIRLLTVAAITAVLCCVKSVKSVCGSAHTLFTACVCGLSSAAHSVLVGTLKFYLCLCLCEDDTKADGWSVGKRRVNTCHERRYQILPDRERRVPTYQQTVT